MKQGLTASGIFQKGAKVLPNPIIPRLASSPGFPERNKNPRPKQRRPPHEVREAGRNTYDHDDDEERDSDRSLPRPFLPPEHSPAVDRARAFQSAGRQSGNDHRAARPRRPSNTTATAALLQERGFPRQVILLPRGGPSPPPLIIQSNPKLGPPRARTSHSKKPTGKERNTTRRLNLRGSHARRNEGSQTLVRPPPPLASARSAWNQNAGRFHYGSLPLRRHQHASTQMSQNTEQQEIQLRKP